eukprot:scaffold69629_cov69-Phaeocystis_antarctica.AAC.3
MPCNEFHRSGRRRRGLRPSKLRRRGPARGAGWRPGRQRGGRRIRWPRLQAAPDGAAIVIVVERAAAALHVVQQALVGRLELLHALLQAPLLLVNCLPQASLLLRQPVRVAVFLLLPLHVAVAQVHLNQVRHDEANDKHALAEQRNLAAEGDSQEAVEQHEAYQPKLVSEPQAVRAVYQRAHHGFYGPFVMHRHRSTCPSHALGVPYNVNGHDQHQ